MGRVEGDSSASGQSTLCQNSPNQQIQLRGIGAQILDQIALQQDRKNDEAARTILLEMLEEAKAKMLIQQANFAPQEKLNEIPTCKNPINESIRERCSSKKTGISYEQQIAEILKDVRATKIQIQLYQDELKQALKIWAARPQNKGRHPPTSFKDIGPGSKDEDVKIATRFTRIAVYKDELDYQARALKGLRPFSLAPSWKDIAKKILAAGKPTSLKGDLKQIKNELHQHWNNPIQAIDERINRVKSMGTQHNLSLRDLHNRNILTEEFLTLQRQDPEMMVRHFLESQSAGIAPCDLVQFYANRRADFNSTIEILNKSLTWLISNSSAASAGLAAATFLPGFAPLAGPMSGALGATALSGGAARYLVLQNGVRVANEDKLFHTYTGSNHSITESWQQIREKESSSAGRELATDVLFGASRRLSIGSEVASAISPSVSSEAKGNIDFLNKNRGMVTEFPWSKINGLMDQGLSDEEIIAQMKDQVIRIRNRLRGTRLPDR